MILKNNKRNISSILLLIGLILCYWLSQHYYFRIDLTSDNRYSLAESTKTLLKEEKNRYTVEMYLSGDLPYGFHKLQKATKEIVEEFDHYSKNNIYYSQMTPDLTQSEAVNNLIKRGLQYTNANIKDKNGKLTQQLLFPAFILHDGKREIAVGLLDNNPKLSGQENLNNSIASLEYKLSNAIRILEQNKKPRIAFLQGQGELDRTKTLDFARTLSENYEVLEVHANQIDSTLNALIIASPRNNFKEQDKFYIDQYIMNGGKTLWLVDEVEVSKDSLRQKQMTMAYYKPLNIEDQLFSYGVRINPDLVLDINADFVKVNTALKGNPPKFVPIAWAYEPLLETNPKHPITKSVLPVRGIFSNSIDPLKVETLHSTILLRTSHASKRKKVPTIISMKEIANMQDPNFYNKKNIPVAVLQEGIFPSVFTGRLPYSHKPNFQTKSVPNKMLIIADGDIIKNETKGSGEQMKFLPLGYNADYKYTHGNKNFLSNAIDYLCDEDGLMELRNKKYTPALLDKTKVRVERAFWQWLNLLSPLLVILLFGITYFLYRKRKYATKK